MIAAQPTRGLDVGSIEYIHNRLIAARDEGDGVLIMSSELDEIMALSDRILVMFKGRIVAEFDATQGPGRPQRRRACHGRSGGMSERPKLDDASRKLLERAAPGRAQFEDLVVVPVFAVIVALILGALTMLATNVDLATIGQSYVALLQGSVGSLNAISETLTAAIPLVLAGLGLALGFRAGLFNIGAEGQILMGGMAAVIMGFSFPGLPFVVLMPLCLLAGALAGALYAASPAVCARRPARMR